jgi:hypothetical protein
MNNREKLVDAILERSPVLKQELTDFVLDAEGELAAALEAYAADKSRTKRGEHTQQDWIIDSFITEGKVGDKTPIDLFIASHPELSPSDRQLINSWHRTFAGLFTITQVLPDSFELMNWLTGKHYTVKLNASQLPELSRFKEGEILLTRISPVTEIDWIFSGPKTIMGKLGKPKLAVAIGNFKENHKNSLYSDAPDLLAEAWQSVELYHQQFTDFFGTDEITLPGYQLNKKMTEFQEIMLKQRLEAAGVDSSKSLAEVAQAAGIDDAELQAAAEEAGVDAKTAAQMLKGAANSKMVMPKIDLPAEIRKAEELTALSHPRWGQMFLPTYSKVETILKTADWQTIPGSEKLIRQYLEDNSFNTFIWKRLAKQYPTQLENVLQTILNRPDFKLDSDLDALLTEFHKPLEPALPEIASVPIHLHNLFQEAVSEVNKSKSKGKVPQKTAKGFQ